ncbi:hypothetical protein PPERSA_01728 [Pseudocohnilembus persalinus]|uniref:Elongator complex protein 4 n=1 Tax=Pseudocohnilembus persalinus TaxID=266149 RepID=A0A0V0Q7S4_PSEPJ|nr:hypothetical protein PPERSA_01728 [Pseudocohnilembus persalinus]|eukprot:KRW98290.1 hypothetical protein PPERSA_01728 [Pseudocohnilembus persalinus]
MQTGVKSSFTKITKNNKDRIFFGHPELDGILGNNIKKGTMILLEEDMPTSIHIQLLRYYIGVGVQLEENCMIYDVFNKKWENVIPAKLNEARLKKKEEEKGEQKSTNQIAWRYDNQKIKLKELDTMVSKDIPRLDLSKTTPNDKNLVTSKNINEYSNLRELFDDICMELQNTLQDENDTKLRRILITNLFGHFSKLKFKQSELTKFLQALKSFARASHILLVISIPQSIDLEKKNLLHFYSDIVLRIQPLFEREELEHFHGILHFVKLAHLQNFSNFKLETLSWGIKASSKRKLEIDRLYLAPEREQNNNQEQDKQEGQNNKEHDHEHEGNSGKEQPIESTYHFNKLEATNYLLKAQCHEANENKIGAIDNYRSCLKKDPTCFEAFNRLLDCYLMTSIEKEQLLSLLNFNPEDIWIKKYYQSIIKNEQLEEVKSPQKGVDNYDNNTLNQIHPMTPNQFQLSPNLNTPQQNRRLINQNSQQNQQKIINRYNNSGDRIQEEVNDRNINSENVFSILIQQDNIDILCIKAKNAHQNKDIQLAYEYCVKAIKKDPLYFQIIPIYCACLLDLNYIGELYYCAHNLIENYPNNSLSWFAIGTYYYLTKKYEDESDQAMSVYRTVSRLFPGCYLAGSVEWIIETILSNLAHTHRKLKDWKNAIQTYERCITLNPKNPQTFFSLAYTYHISNQLNKAICYYHKSLHYKHDNPFVLDMLNKCLQDASDLPWDSVYNV